MAAIGRSDGRLAGWNLSRRATSSWQSSNYDASRKGAGGARLKSSGQAQRIHRTAPATTCLGAAHVDAGSVRGDAETERERA